jgi:hypothetical protein
VSTKVEKCRRCGKRYRGHAGWNEDYVAGLVAGLLCPDCQTAEENLGAEVNLVLSPPSGRRAVKMNGSDDMVKLINGLVDTYPTPEIMRAKADRLAGARKDLQASEMVRLMRTLADDMDSGELWEDET